MKADGTIDTIYQRYTSAGEEAAHVHH